MSAPKQFTSISSDLLEPRLPELGKIKIGGKGKVRKSRKGHEYRLPVKIDHFRVVTREKDNSDNWILDERVHGKEGVGPKPKELDVRLLFDEPEENFQYFLAAYTGPGQCRCKGNGEVAMDSEQGEIPCPCPLLKQFEGKYDGPNRPAKVTCKPHGRLSVVLEAAESFGGFYVFRTTSWETISNLASQMRLFREQFGFLAGLPLKLVIYPAQVQYEEGGSTKTAMAYKVALVLRANYMDALRLASVAHEERTRLALPAGADVAEIHRKQLAAAEERDAGEIAKEFHEEVGDDVPEEVDFEVVDEDDGSDQQLHEDLCYAALEIAGWEQVDINKQIAKYEGQLEELAPILYDNLPKEIERAATDLAQKAIDEGEKDRGGAFLELLTGLKENAGDANPVEDDAPGEAAEAEPGDAAGEDDDEDAGVDEEAEDASEAEAEEEDDVPSLF